MNAGRALTLALLFASLACAGKAGAKKDALTAAPIAGAQASSPESKLFAVFETDKGRFEARLFPKEAPKTVARFKESAEGGRYDGAAFLRVIPDFLVQAGVLEASTAAPMASVAALPRLSPRSDPSVDLPIESSAALGFDRPGLLAMAAAGAQGGSDQFFVTLAAAPWLSGKNTLFGEVVAGIESVRAIASLPRVERDPATGVLIDRPADAVAIKSVRIESR
ncbi:MAG: peptidylprolyl isomerase [Elusimicrobiota bacterium]